MYILEELKVFPFFDKKQSECANVNYFKRTIPKGTIVFREGDECGGVPFVLKGMIRVSKIGKNGREIILYRLKSGDACILTIASVLSNIAYPATAIIEEDAEIVLLTVDQFKTLMARNLDLQHFVYKILSGRFLDIMTLIDEIIFSKIDERLIKFLLEKTQKNGDIIEMTHDEIAIELGTAREVISRVMKGLEREGYIHLLRGKVRITGREVLEGNLSEY